jgi:hypothetical protein
MASTNMAIPESLARQDYWYRSEFPVSADLAQRHLMLTSNGINYSAEIWLNGGASRNGRGCVHARRVRCHRQAQVRHGECACRARFTPAASRYSARTVHQGRTGENGGAMALHGPTFIATEGWDWIPCIRDRNTGRSWESQARGMSRLHWVTRGERLIDVRHEALKKSPQGRAASLYPGALESPAVHSVADDSLTPHLALKVNGVRIASRGGNWDDDARKRVSRERLEPHFACIGSESQHYPQLDRPQLRRRLLRSGGRARHARAERLLGVDAGFSGRAADPSLFLANARDVIARYRNHPSIALWFVATGLEDSNARLRIRAARFHWRTSRRC